MLVLTVKVNHAARGITYVVFVNGCCLTGDSAFVGLDWSSTSTATDGADKLSVLGRISRALSDVEQPSSESRSRQRRLLGCTVARASPSSPTVMVPPPLLYSANSSPAGPPRHLAIDSSARAFTSAHTWFGTLLGIPKSLSRQERSTVTVFESRRPSESRVQPAIANVGPTGNGCAVVLDATSPGSSLEIVDAAAESVTVIPASSLRRPQAVHGADESMVVGLHSVGSDSGDVAAVLADGTVCVVQTDADALQRSLLSWQRLMGIRDGKPLTLKGFRQGVAAVKSPPALTAPKHGKEDDKNEPHVGGSTWAGGTGGSNTAGLGGRGGPYRLDKGHTVHQISDELKAEVSADAMAQARAMAQQALSARLAEIQMSQQQLDAYTSVLSRVQREVNQLRVVLQSVDSREKERQWLRNQSTGDLDDGKLVDGVAGEALVFRRRGHAPTNPNAPVTTSKRQKLHFILDCSGSMYRFNGVDGRLNRVLEFATLVMEGLHSSSHKFDYAIVGHSGDSDCIPLVSCYFVAVLLTRAAHLLCVS